MYAPSRRAFNRDRRPDSPQKIVNDAVRSLHVRCLGVDGTLLIFQRTNRASHDLNALTQQIAQRLLQNEDLREALSGITGIRLL